MCIRDRRGAALAAGTGGAGAVVGALAAARGADYGSLALMGDAATTILGRDAGRGFVTGAGLAATRQQLIGDKGVDSAAVPSRRTPAHPAQSSLLVPELSSSPGAAGVQSAARPASGPALLPTDPVTGAPASAAPLQFLLLGDGATDLAGGGAGSRQQIRQAAGKLEPASPAVENAAFDLAAAGHRQAQAWAEAGRSPVQADGHLDPQFVEEVVRQKPEPAATLAAEQAAAHVPEDERLSIGEAVALGVTTRRTIPASQVRRGCARAVKAAGRDGDLDTALQGELGIGSQAVFGGRAEQTREVVERMQGAGLGNELGRQLVETVGEGLERNPRLSVQQFREGRLGRMRQWDRATGDPETTDRVVEGLIALGPMQATTVHEVPMPPAPPSQPAITSTETEAATQVAPSSAESSPSAATVPTPCLLYTSPSPRDRTRSRMPSSA